MEFKSLDGAPQPSAVMPQGTWRAVIEGWQIRRRVRKAAPDLLWALREAEGFISECDADTVRAAEEYGTLPTVRAALAKVEF